MVSTRAKRMSLLMLMVGMVLSDHWSLSSRCNTIANCNQKKSSQFIILFFRRLNDCSFQRIDINYYRYFVHSFVQTFECWKVRRAYMTWAVSVLKGQNVVHCSDHNALQCIHCFCTHSVPLYTHCSCHLRPSHFSTFICMKILILIVWKL